MLRRRSRTVAAVVLALTMVLNFWPVLPSLADQQGTTDVREEAIRFIQENYVEEVGPEVLEKESIAEMIEALGDPYSVFLTADEYQDFLVSTGGSFGGVGMRVEQQGEYVIVAAPLPGTPAEKAGLKPGDKILKVDNIDVVGQTMEKVVHLIRGEPGTVVLLTIARDGEPEPLIFSLSREIIDLDMTEGKLLEDKIGYIRLHRFSQSASSDLDKQLAQLKSQGARGYILDLRDNPGGYLTAALGVSSTFLPLGNPLVHIVSRADGDTTYVSTTPALDVPLVVLVNEGSASASEIVAGAVQDSGKGIVVGTKSFGKGSVQSLKELSDGSAIKLTTAKYLTPNKREINSVGVTPDYMVEDPEEQLEKAVALLKEQIARLKPEVHITLAIDDREVLINHVAQELSHPPYLTRGITMVPVRLVGEAFGAQVMWDGDKKTVTVTFHGNNIILPIGAGKANVNGEEQALPAAPVINNGTSFVPARFIAEAFGAHVVWEAGSQRVIITLN